MRDRFRRFTGTVAAAAGRAVRSLPGIGSMGCAVTGTAVLWGAGWAFLTAAGYLLALALEVN